MGAESTVATVSLVGDYIAKFPDEAAAELERLSATKVAKFLSGLATDRAAAMLDRLRSDVMADVLPELDEGTVRRVLPAVDPLRAAVSLARLDPAPRELALGLLDPRTAGELRALTTYPPHSAGAIMDPRVTMLRAEATAEETLGLIRQLRERRIQNVWVVDSHGKYLGRVPLQELAIAEPSQTLAGLMTGPAVSVHAMASQTEVVEKLERHRVSAIPVVDFEGRLIGLIRHQALLAAVEQEASADIQTMVGASRDERALSPVFFAVRKRLPWLQVNLLTAFLASFVVGMFEDTIARFTALAVLLPVVAGQSGNTGAQALAVTMRGLALREIRVRQALRVAVKESLVGAINGVAVAVVTALAVYLWSRSPGLAAVIGVAMVVSMLIAGLAGAVIPVLLTSLGQDPAQASSIVLTTITDVVGFLSFLGLATLAAGVL